MSSSAYQTVVVPITLGDASRFDRTIFPLSYRKKDNLGLGDLYLDATLDELLRINSIGANPHQWKELLTATKTRYDRLMLEKLALEDRPKTWNPLKALSNYRAARMFLAASKSLYVATKTRSEEMKRTVGRTLLSVPQEEVVPVNGDLPPGSELTAIAIRLDHPLDDTTMQQIASATDTIANYSGPFDDDQLTSEATGTLNDTYFSALESVTSLDHETTENALEIINLPIQSPPSIVVNIKNFSSTSNTYHGSILSSNSSVQGATIQLSGSRNSGSTTRSATSPN